MYIVIAIDAMGNKGHYGPFFRFQVAREWRDEQRKKNPGFDIEVVTLYEPNRLGKEE